MALTLNQINNKILAVKKINKITNSIKTISIIKISKLKTMYQINNEYMKELYYFIDKLHSYVNNHNSTSKRKLFIVFVSEGGLTGGYNKKCLNLLQKHYNQNDEIIVFGKKGFKKINLKSQLAEIDYDNNLLEDLEKISHQIISKYFNNEIGEVITIHNKLSEKTATLTKILPLSLPKIDKPNKFINISIDEEELNILLNFYITNVLNTILLEAQLSENISKRDLMITSNDNISNIINELSLMKNKKRQEMITNSLLTIVQ